MRSSQLISQNVANASTPGYAVEISNQQALTADGVGLGVYTGPATLQIDQALQASLTQQNATVAGLQTTQTSLQAIDSVLGTPGSGSDIGSLLGNLQDSFSTLMTDPSNQTQQSAVVSSATTLAQGINTLSASYGTQRQAAQTDLGSAITTLNSTLATIGQLSNQIIALQADQPEHRRFAEPAERGGADLVSTAQHPDGGATERRPVDIHHQRPQPADQRRRQPVQPCRPGPQPAGSYYPGGGISGIMLGGSDVTSGMTGGQIGADITLRDTTLPTDQSELDEFAQGLSSRFAGQGLTLFSDPTGNVPAGGGTPVQAGYVGLRGDHPGQSRGHGRSLPGT